MATVNGKPITRVDYDDYASVFTDSAGHLSMDPNDVLISLINQLLVREEAVRRGLTVSDETVEAALDGMEAGIQPLGGELQAGVAADAGFRARMRLFLLFRVVRDAVIPVPAIQAAELRDAYDADPSLHVVSFEVVAPRLRERLASAKRDILWSDWLALQRACAGIAILDRSFDVPSSTARPDC